MHPLRVKIQQGTLAWKMRTLLLSVDKELLRRRDDSGKLPVHTACQTNTPVDALDTLVERNAATRHMAQFVTAVVVRRPSSPVRCNFSWTAVVSALWLFFQSRRCVAFRHKNSLSIVVSGPILDSTFPRFSGNAYQHCHIPVHDGC